MKRLSLTSLASGSNWVKVLDKVFFSQMNLSTVSTLTPPSNGEKRMMGIRVGVSVWSRKESWKWRRWAGVREDGFMVSVEIISASISPITNIRHQTDRYAQPRFVNNYSRSEYCDTWLMITTLKYRYLSGYWTLHNHIWSDSRSKRRWYVMLGS